MRSTAELVDDLAEHTERLVDAYTNLAEIDAKIVSERTQAWIMSPAESISGKDREASFHVASLESERVLLRGEVSCLETQIATTTTLLTVAARH